MQRLSGHNPKLRRQRSLYA